MRSGKINSILKYWRKLSNSSWIYEVINEGGIQKSRKQTLMEKNSSMRSESELIWSGIMQMTTLFHAHFGTWNISRILKSVCWAFVSAKGQETINYITYITIGLVHLFFKISQFNFLAPQPPSVYPKRLWWIFTSEGKQEPKIRELIQKGICNFVELSTSIKFPLT